MPLDWFTQGFQASSNGTRALGLLGQTANTQQQQSDWLQPRNSNVKINWRPKFSGAHAELMMITKLTKTIWMKKKKSSATCCITGALEHQEDFHQQDKTALFKIIQEAGHLCFFLPKFHSELNNRAVLGDSQGAYSEELSLQHQCGGEVHAECCQSRLWRLHQANI